MNARYAIEMDTSQPIVIDQRSFSRDPIGERARAASTSATVDLRPFPYTYQSLFAVCSDLDETPDKDVYYQIAKYLNTTGQTRMGRGVGLEIGNTIYFHMPAGQFAYHNTDDAGRSLIHAMIRSGHIDCLHSFGDHADTRDHAKRALDELRQNDCHLEVWIDHAQAPTNLDPGIMEGRGDGIGSPAYHADLTWNYGVRYVWRGRVTSVIGQNRPRSLAGVIHAGHPLASAKTVAKEWTKGVVARMGNAKYAMHGPNDALRYTKLSGGQPVIEFLRCNPYWGGVENADTADGVAKILTRKLFQRLVDRRGVCIFYTHLGKIADPREPFRAPTRAAFEILAEFSGDGKILVATTRRLLGYCRAIREIRPRAIQRGAETIIELTTRTEHATELGPLSHSDLAGLTFYADRPEQTRIEIDGQPVRDARVNSPDESGRPSISIPWPRLEFPN